MKKINNSFHSYGFAAVKDVVDVLTNQLAVKELLHKANTKQLPQYYGYEVFGPNARALLKSVLNPENPLMLELKNNFPGYYIFPDFVIQVGSTPAQLVRPHQDLQSFLRHGQRKKILKTGYAKVGIYLTGTSKDGDGVIHAVPGSHKSKLFKLAFCLPLFASRVSNALRNFYKNHQTPIGAPNRSALFFHGLLLHSSSPERFYTQAEGPKIALYFSVVSKEGLRSYLITELNKYVEERFSAGAVPCQRLGYFETNPYEDLEMYKFYKSHTSGSELAFFSFSSSQEHLG